MKYATILRMRFLTSLFLALGFAAADRVQAQVFQELFSFGNANPPAEKGLNPDGLVLGDDGNFYGTTANGGAGDVGTFFKMTPLGTLTTRADVGGSPGLIKGNNGTFYGTIGGSLARMTPSGKLTHLAGFASSGGLVQDPQGNFYGTTDAPSGASGYGSVFKISPSGQHTTLVDFDSSSNGARPATGLVRGVDGNFYGTTKEGGANDNGTFYQMTPAGVLTTLLDITDNGGFLPGTGDPDAALLLGPNGNFYGTIGGKISVITPSGVLTPLANEGSSCALVAGPDGKFYGKILYNTSQVRVVQISTDGTPAGTTVTTLHDFTTDSIESSGMTAPLVAGADGNLYGCTRGAGDVMGTTDFGSIFRLVFSGAPNLEMREAVVIDSTTAEVSVDVNARGESTTVWLEYGTDGITFPNAVQMGSAVTGYATTTVSTTLSGLDASTEYYFRFRATSPQLNLYGVTSQGGTGDLGTVFRMTPGVGLTTLADFTGYDGSATVGTRGKGPYSGLVLGNDGNFYGTTFYGGAYDRGSVFRMTPAGVVTTLVDFTGYDETGTTATRGSLPGGLVLGSNGNFYGMTHQGGANDYGSIFQMTPAGVITTLVDFTDYDETAPTETRGSSPSGALVLGSDGNFYGTTEYGGANGSGTVFRMTPAGVMTTLVDFTGYDGTATIAARGSYPAAGLVLGSDGNFYGTAKYGGANSSGTVFQMTPAGVMTTLVDFTGWDGTSTTATRGGYPSAEMVVGGDGNFYGTTLIGGANNMGTVFQMTPAGVMTTLVDFSGTDGTATIANRGSYSYAALVLGSDGNFYGTTQSGGADNFGTVFQMTPAGGMTTLVDFTGPDGTSTTATRGSNPYTALLSTADVVTVSPVQTFFTGTVPTGPPANDDFANPLTLTGVSSTGSGTNLNATIESGEPSHAGQPGGHSVWWTWTAPADGPVTIDTAGSNFDTTLGVYTGASVAALTEIASNDDTFDTRSQVTFSAVSGTVYFIAVDGFNGATGTVSLHLDATTPANDHFANAQIITGDLATISGSNRNATEEGGEPVHAGQPGGHSVWWTWTAPHDGAVLIDSAGSNFDATIAVYTGSSVGILTEIASDSGSFGFSSQVMFSAVSGTVYHIAVDGFEGATGSISLHLDSTLPANNDFGSAQKITGESATLTATNINASNESGEPDHAGQTGGHSVWWTWKAPANGPVSIDTLGSNFDTILGVYTGSSLATLTEVASNYETFGFRSQVTFTAVAGTVYRIAVDGYNGATGTISFHLSWVFDGKPVYERIYSFTDARAWDIGKTLYKGNHPLAGLVEGADGNFYGTTEIGGSFGTDYGSEGAGTIFRITPDGVLTTLVEFTGDGAINKGRSPAAALLQGNDGNFYGTTARGGAGDSGTIFKMTPAGVLTTLANLSATGLVQGADGDFYGTTPYGGYRPNVYDYGFGTVFKMTDTGDLTTLVEFTGNGASNKGSTPSAALVQGSDGNFYGTTSGGGAFGLGTVFKMTPDGVLTTLVEFTGNGPSNKGYYPSAALVQGSDGDFYGTTILGGEFDSGTVFKITPAGVLTTLVEFAGDGSENRGSRPAVALVQGVDGDFYGTTGPTAPPFGSGPNPANATIFKMTPAGVLTTLVELTGSEADLAALIQGSNGNFYGTSAGSSFSEASLLYEGSTIFKMTPSGQVSTLVKFTGKGSSYIGSRPESTLLQVANGDFYGTTVAGGTDGLGTVFKMNSAGELTSLVEFTGAAPGNKGAAPIGGLILGADGNFYGTTATGGDSDEVYSEIEYQNVIGHGTIFKITPAGVLTTLVEFSGNGPVNKGAYPAAALVQGSDGNFYGTTAEGGGFGYGTVFMMTPAGVLTTLVEFTNYESPQSALVQGADGNFYGTTPYGGYLPTEYDYGFGTVFKMTPAGVLTTLVEFDDSSIAGLYPYAALTEGSDGNFYGTTSSGGIAAGYIPGPGTIFKVTPAGALTTLFYFDYFDPINTGRYPYAPLIQGNDGNLYGTTQSGGEFLSGIAFKMSITGQMTTLMDFSGEDGPPGSLIQGADGALYGVSKGTGSDFLGGITGPDGSIFRLIFRGVPYVSPFNPQVKGVSSALLQANLNPAGAATSVTLEYGTDGVTFPNHLTIPPNFTGYQSILIGRTIEGLTLGTTYYYQFRAVNSAGETVSPVMSFSTYGQPLVTAEPATEIGPTSARFHGTVNARDYESIVSFEWGTDGNNFPNRTPVDQGPINGRNVVPVSASVAGLIQGVTYYYRVVGTNAGGTGISGSQSFRTLANPTATLGEPTAITSQSATLHGSVNAEGSSAAVIFEYGTDGVTFPSSIGATPPTVTGDLTFDVSAHLSGLTQGQTYYYRIRATSAGGIGVSSTGTLALDILSGFVQVFPDPPPEAQGFVFVTLFPAGVGGWRFEGEQLWRSSGIPVGGLATGDRTIQFRPVPGYLQPPAEIVGVVSGGAATFIERIYYETPAAGTGGLAVTLKPEALAATSVPVADRAQWRLLGEDDTQWRDSEVTLGGLAAGNYLVECKPVAGRNTPPPANVLVVDSQTTATTLTYFIADPVTGTFPALVPFETVSTDQTKPYAYVGQFRSNAGSSSGFVVKPRVVATAGHVVFDDGTLAAVEGLQWLFQRHSGTYEPKPQIPRGFYIFDGYAAQRTLENTPGSSSPASQTLDAASVYFLADAGRGGFGGFLASDALDNEFLLSSAQKTLVGYPVDGIPPINQGKMHATPPADVSFTRAFGKTYITSAIRSAGGTSGGPLCVQFENGTYYPAAIYLGGTGQTVVRAIDSQVIDLFNRAEVSGNGGDNNTGGGITHSSFATIGSATQPGALEVTIQPAAARDSGAGWRLKPETSYRPSGNQKAGLNPGSYKLQLNTIVGFEAPTQQTVDLNGGQLAQVTFTYQPVNVAPTISNVTNFHIDEDTSSGPVSVTVDDVDNPNNSLVLSGFSSNTSLIPNGNIVFGGSGSNRTVTVTPAANQNGSATISLTVSDGDLDDTDIFIVTVDPVNDTPTISGITTQSIPVNTNTGAISFTIGDIETSASSLTLARSTSNSTLIPLSGIVFGGSGASRNVTITPTSNQLGSASVTVTVSDGDLTASRKFTVTVTGTAIQTWRFANFGTTANTGSSADNSDADGDGVNNHDEFAAGTNPNNPADVFRILSSSKSGSSFVVTVEGKAGRTYTLQRSGNLAGSWPGISSLGPLAGDGPVQLSDDSASPGISFYRVRVTGP